MTHKTQHFSCESQALAPTVNLLDARDVFAAVAMHFDRLDIDSSLIVFGCGASPNGEAGVMLSRMRIDEGTEPEWAAFEVSRLALNLQALGATHLAILATGSPVPGECKECPGERAECFDRDRHDTQTIDLLVALCDLVAEACLMRGLTIPCALHAYEGPWALSTTADGDYWKVAHLGLLEESQFAASAVASGIPFREKVEREAMDDAFLASVRSLCESDTEFRTFTCLEGPSRSALEELSAQHARQEREGGRIGDGDSKRLQDAVHVLASLAALGPGRDHIIAHVVESEQDAFASPSVAIASVFEDPEFLPGPHLMPGGQGDRVIEVFKGLCRTSNAWDCSPRYREALANLGAIAAFLLWFSGRMGEAFRLADDILAAGDHCDMAELVLGLAHAGICPLWLEKTYASTHG